MILLSSIRSESDVPTSEFPDAFTFIPRCSRTTCSMFTFAFDGIVPEVLINSFGLFDTTRSWITFEEAGGCSAYVFTDGFRDEGRRRRNLLCRSGLFKFLRPDRECLANSRDSGSRWLFGMGFGDEHGNRELESLDHRPRCWVLQWRHCESKHDDRNRSHLRERIRNRTG